MAVFILWSASVVSWDIWFVCRVNIGFVMILNTLPAFGRCFNEWCCWYSEGGYSLRVKKTKNFLLKFWLMLMNFLGGRSKEVFPSYLLAQFDSCMYLQWHVKKMKFGETEGLRNSQKNYLVLPTFFLSIWHVYFPFPVFKATGNNIVGFALKENDSFCCVQHLVSLRCVYFSNGTVVWNFDLYFISKMLFMIVYRNF